MSDAGAEEKTQLLFLNAASSLGFCCYVNRREGFVWISGISGTHIPPRAGRSVCLVGVDKKYIAIVNCFLSSRKIHIGVVVYHRTLVFLLRRDAHCHSLFLEMKYFILSKKIFSEISRPLRLRPVPAKDVTQIVQPGDALALVEPCDGERGSLGMKPTLDRVHRVTLQTRLSV